MKKVFLALAALSTTFSFIACDDSSSVSATSIESSSSEFYESLGDLPNCTSKREGDTHFVQDEKEDYICVDGKWISAEESSSSSSSSVNEKSSSSTKDTKPAESSSSSINEKSSSSTKDPKPTEESSSSDASSSSVESSSSINDESSFSEEPGSAKGTLTDLRDGQVYKTIKIGTQTWMAENLNYAYTGVKMIDRYGTSDSTSWCYENKVSNCGKFGRFYTWSAVMDSAAQFSENAGTQCGVGRRCTPNTLHRGICPKGWHVPTKEEYNVLLIYIGGNNYAGMELKSIRGWVGSAKSEEGADRFGFSALPAGYRSRLGRYYELDYATYFWTASENKDPMTWSFYENAVYYGIMNDNNDVHLMNYDKGVANSLRCLKD